MNSLFTKKNKNEKKNSRICKKSIARRYDV